MPAIKATDVPEQIGTGYPPPHDQPCRARATRRLSAAFGLAHLGVNLRRIPPGCASSQRHWHSHEDEFAYLLAGELVLVTDAGEQTLVAGDCIGFPANSTDGHQFVNRSNSDALLLDIGTRSHDDVVTYSDIDLLLLANHYHQSEQFRHKDGTAY